MPAELILKNDQKILSYDRNKKAPNKWQQFS